MKQQDESGNKATHPLDAMAAAPGHHTVLFENGKVRVLDTAITPGQQTPLRSPWAAPGFPCRCGAPGSRR